MRLHTQAGDPTGDTRLGPQGWQTVELKPEKVFCSHGRQYAPVLLTTLKRPAWHGAGEQSLPGAVVMKPGRQGKQPTEPSAP